MVNISLRAFDSKVPSWEQLDKTASRMARQWMREHVQEFVDPLTDEVNSTAMAEEAAFQVGMADRWLDDHQSIVWELAIQVADEFINTDPRFWRW